MLAAQIFNSRFDLSVSKLLVQSDKSFGSVEDAKQLLAGDACMKCPCSQGPTPSLSLALRLPCQGARALAAEVRRGAGHVRQQNLRAAAFGLKR